MCLFLSSQWLLVFIQNMHRSKTRICLNRAVKSDIKFYIPLFCVRVWIHSHFALVSANKVCETVCAARRRTEKTAFLNTSEHKLPHYVRMNKKINCFFKLFAFSSILCRFVRVLSCSIHFEVCSHYELHAVEVEANGFFFSTDEKWAITLMTKAIIDILIRIQRSKWAKKAIWKSNCLDEG